MTVIVPDMEGSLSAIGKQYFYRKHGFTADVARKYITFMHDTGGDPGTEKISSTVAEIRYRECILPAFSQPAHIRGEGKIIATAEKDGDPYPCIVDNGVDTIIGFDPFFTMGFSLSGQLEPIWKRMGKEKEKYTRVSFVDVYSDILFAALCRAFGREGMPLVFKSFWPEGKKFAVCLTHDVDEIRKTYQWVTYPSRMVRKKDFQGLKNQYRSLKQKMKGIEPFWTFPGLLALERELNVRSSFYFLHERGKVKILDPATWRHLGRRYSPEDPRVASLIRSLHDGGWEVGLHGSFYSFRDPEMIRNEKGALEHVLGSKIQGIRQHNLNLAVPDTWQYQAEVGLTYDTTLGFNDTVGFRWGTCFPFRLYNYTKNRPIDLLEIPLVMEEIALFKKNDYNSQSLLIESEVQRVRGVLTLLWHPGVMNQYEFPGWGEFYEGIIRRCIQGNAWITHGAAITDWWKKREQLPLRWSYHDHALTIDTNPIESGYFDIVLPSALTIENITGATILIRDRNAVTIRAAPGDSGRIRIDLEG
jgi:hypothetical protein